MTFAIKHQFFDFLRLIGLRDRLRCPHCHAIGTWKPHGGWLDFTDKRKVRRWLCKYCGVYVGPEGRKLAEVVGPSWVFCDGPTRQQNTPEIAVIDWLGREVSPWAG